MLDLVAPIFSLAIRASQMFFSDRSTPPVNEIVDASPIAFNGQNFALDPSLLNQDIVDFIFPLSNIRESNILPVLDYFIRDTFDAPSLVNVIEQFAPNTIAILDDLNNFPYKDIFDDILFTPTVSVIWEMFEHTINTIYPEVYSNYENYWHVINNIIDSIVDDNFSIPFELVYKIFTKYGVFPSGD